MVPPSAGELQTTESERAGDGDDDAPRPRACGLRLLARTPAVAVPKTTSVTAVNASACTRRRRFMARHPSQAIQAAQTLSERKHITSGRSLARVPEIAWGTLRRGGRAAVWAVILVAGLLAG